MTVNARLLLAVTFRLRSNKQITQKNHTQKKTAGREGGETGSGHLSLMATEGGCASTRGHSANLECSFEVREGQVRALNRKVKFRAPTCSLKPAETTLRVKGGLMGRRVWAGGEIARK